MGYYVMKAHVIEDGKVVNTISVNALTDRPNLISAENGGSRGDLWDGENFTTPAPVVTAPQTITQIQGMKALHRAGKKKAIKTMLSAPGNEEANIAFEYERTWRRDSQFIADLAPALGMTEAEVDDLFVTAAGIV